MKGCLLILALAFLGSAMFACKPKKCANFSDPQKEYKARVDKNGLIKKKGSKPHRHWNNY